MTTWSQILVEGVIYPRSKPCKEDLQAWIDDHATLLECLRKQVLRSVIDIELSVRERKEIESRIGMASIKGLCTAASTDLYPNAKD